METKKNEATQQGFANYFQAVAEHAREHDEMIKEQAQEREEEQARKETAPAPKRKGSKETFTKHNLTFSDTLFQKLKYIQLSTGKTQRELLDGAVRKFVEEFESKNGIIKFKSIEL